MTMQFGLHDVPDDWEIELNQDFVDYIDQRNRPWKWVDGVYHPENHGRGCNCTYWPAGEWSKKRDPDMKRRTPEFQRKHKFYARLWGYHRYHDAHVGRYGYNKPCDTGNWIKRPQTTVIQDAIPYTDAELEQYVTGFRKGKFSDNVREFKVPRLPIHANAEWAWLLGCYFSCGTVYHRIRYYDAEGVTVRLRVKKPVVPKLMALIRGLGGQPHYMPLKDRPMNKDKGLGTTRRKYVVLGWPEYLVLHKFGLPDAFKNDVLDGSGSRSIQPRIPDWIKGNDAFMRSFIEGYINGSGMQTILFSSSVMTSKQQIIADVERISQAVKPSIPVLWTYIRCTGRPESYVKAFIQDINDWLEKQGICGRFRKLGYYPVQGHYQYELAFVDKHTRQWFMKNFHIIRPDIRARFCIREKADSDPVLYEILRHLMSPANVVLGVIVEKPRTQDAIKKLLQMRKEGVEENLNLLVNIGVIKQTSDGLYYYSPEKYTQHRLLLYNQALSKMTAKIKRYARGLMFQCEGCQEVSFDTDRCPYCSGDLTPIERKTVLSALERKLMGVRIRKRRIKNEVM